MTDYHDPARTWLLILGAITIFCIAFVVIAPTLALATAILALTAAILYHTVPWLTRRLLGLLKWVWSALFWWKNTSEKVADTSIDLADKSSQELHALSSKTARELDRRRNQ